MIILEDTRNQIGKHETLNAQLELMGCQVMRSKLFVGDYTLATDQHICIDTKKDILELAGNICGRQHERFRAECERAKISQIRLIILIEEQTPIQEWKSPRNRRNQALTQVKGETLYKAMNTMHERYGVEFIQCDKRETAYKIKELLTQ